MVHKRLNSWGDKDMVPTSFAHCLSFRVTPIKYRGWNDLQVPFASESCILLTYLSLHSAENNNVTPMACIRLICFQTFLILRTFEGVIDIEKLLYSKNHRG